MNWKKYGLELLGSDTNSISNANAVDNDAGYSVSLSQNGLVLATGIPHYSTYTGRVVVYDYINSQWTARPVLNGTSNYDHFGYSVDLSSDGSILIVGAPQLKSSKNGYVKTFFWNGNDREWTLIGDITQTPNLNLTNGEGFGWKVRCNFNNNSGIISDVSAITNDKLKIFISSVFFEFSNPHFKGKVRILNLKDSLNSLWEVEKVFTGDSNNMLGVGLGVSRNGLVLAIGAHLGNYVKTYSYSSSLGWVQQGLTINGTSGTTFGWTVSLNNTGSRLAVGNNYYNGNGNKLGAAYVYEYKNDQNQWVQLGSTIEGTTNDDELGICVSLNDEGNILATAALQHPNNNQRGQVSTYKLVNGDWQLYGMDTSNKIDGDYNGDQIGWGLSLNGSGNMLAICSRFKSNNYNIKAGFSQVYRYKQTTNLQLNLQSRIFGETFPLITTNSDGPINFSQTPIDGNNNPLVQLNGIQATALRTGASNISVSQPENDDYLSSNLVSGLIIVNQAVTNIIFIISNKVYGDASFELSAFTDRTDGSGTPNDFTFESLTPSLATVNGRIVTIEGAGLGAQIRASITSNSNYLGTSQIATFDITKAVTIINMPNINKILGDPVFSLNPSSNRPGDFIFELSNPVIAEIVGTNVTIKNSGITQIIIKQLETNNYLYGETLANLTVTTDKPTPNVILNDLVRNYISGNFNLNLSSNSDGSFLFTSSNNGVVSILGNLFNVNSAGTSIITVVQNATGSFGTFTGSFNLTILKSKPTINFPNFTKTITTPKANLFPINIPLNPISNSPGPISYSIIQGNGTMVNNILTLIRINQIVVQLNQEETPGFLSETLNTQINFGILNKTMIYLKMFNKKRKKFKKY